MARPFGWLVVAEPTDLIDVEAAELRASSTPCAGSTRNGPGSTPSGSRAGSAELDAFREAGLWNVRVLVGASDVDQLNVDRPDARRGHRPDVAPVPAARPDRAMDLADALAATGGDPADSAAVPFSATAGVLAALAGLPRREVPGVRVLDVGYFDVTAEPPGEAAVSLGAILDGKDRQVGNLGVPLTTLNRHALITGATGSGKSQTVKHLLGQLTEAKVPWLVVEPVKSEYASIAVPAAS